jgi:dTDP-4-dehydrorhamnose reductase
MRVAVMGASGLLGKYLLREWKTDEVLGLTSKDVDIRDANRVRQVVAGARPDWIVLAAAYTDVDGCESNPDLAFLTNCSGAVNVTEAARDFGSRLIFLSTDYVFGGTKTSPYETTDACNPINVYGRSKAEAEVKIGVILPSACIVRTSWLFGMGGKCFPETILKLGANRPVIDVVDDQRGCPTYARDLARAIAWLCGKNAEGIVHVTSSGSCTWFEFAEEIVRVSGLKTTIQPTTSEKLRRPAARPRYSVLSGASLVKHEFEMPSWQEALKAYLAERATAHLTPDGEPEIRRRP